MSKIKDVEDLRWKIHDFDDNVRVRLLVRGKRYRILSVKSDPNDDHGILIEASPKRLKKKA